MRFFIIGVFLLLISKDLFSQSSVAKLKYEQAEEAFLNYDLTTTLSKLDEVQKLLGEVNPKILYLRIMAQSKLIQEDSTLLAPLKKNCSYYLKTYDGRAGLEDKYKEVFQVSEKLVQYEPNADFNSGIAYLTNREYESGIRSLKKAALAGYGKAAYHLGNLYYNGVGVAKDQVEAVKWYQKAADKESVAGLRSLGYMYLNGYGGLAKNEEKALEYYKAAAETRDLTSMKVLANFFNESYGDPHSAIMWYKRGAEKGDGYCTGMIGVIHYFGENGFDKDLAVAKTWFDKGAAMGDNQSMYFLGVMSNKGIQVPVDYATAFNWFTKATERGNYFAWASLADLYEKGNGVKKDKKKADELREMQALWKEYGIANNWDNHTTLNNIAWSIYEKSDDSKRLELGLMCVKRSLKLNESPYNIGTYASLLYKIGNYKDALLQAEKSVQLKRMKNLDTKITDELIQKIKAKL